MTNLRIALDLDGVVYNWEGTARFLLEHHYGIVLPTSSSWNYIQDHTPKEVWRWLWADAITKHGLYRHGHVYKGAIEGVRQLADLGDVVIVTSRPKTAILDTLDWLAYNRFPVAEVHILGNNQEKTSVQADVLIDDAVHNVNPWVTKGRTAILMDRPWNQQGAYTAAPKLFICYTWPDVVRQVAELADSGDSDYFKETA